MPGPTPKDPALRQRRNKTATGARLSLAPSDVEAPELPERTTAEGEAIPWHPRTLDWWGDVWASPMAAEFLEADHHALFLLAELEDAFHAATSVSQKLELSKEIRLQRQAFGLSPIDRRRLQWEIERTEDAKDRGQRRRSSRPSVDGDESKTTPAQADPRLSVVQ